MKLNGSGSPTSDRHLVIMVRNNWSFSSWYIKLMTNSHQGCQIIKWFGLILSELWPSKNSQSSHSWKFFISMIFCEDWIFRKLTASLEVAPLPTSLWEHHHRALSSWLLTLYLWEVMTPDAPNLIQTATSTINNKLKVIKEVWDCTLSQGVQAVIKPWSFGVT